MDLQFNPRLYYPHQQNIKNQPLQKSININYNFLIDTVSIPFIDDFSTNKIKNLASGQVDSTMITSTSIAFTVNGVYQDSLQFMDDTTWYYITDTTMQKDSFPNSQWEVIYYTNSLPIDTVYFWPNYSHDSISGQLNTITYYTPDSVIYNQSDTYYTIPDDSISLWLGADVFINSTYPIEPPTIGVATFDGVDSIGVPYDFTHENTYGIADYLTSKPINLSYQSSDSIYLSFFYQPEGRGNEPDKKDSLVLEFYSTADANWHWIWGVGGMPYQDFEQVLLPVTDSKYLQNGFRFRFKNYATLSGNLDHWHIDYVRLDKDRSINDTIIDDVAFIYNAPSFIKDYTSMPWKHFKLFPDSFMQDSITLELWNHKDTLDAVWDTYYVFDNDSNKLIKTSKPQSHLPTPNVSPFSKFNIYHKINLPDNNFKFPTDSKYRKTFIIVNTLLHGRDLMTENDSINSNQVFDTYYAYDDGVAEKAYYVNGNNAKLAYEFTLHDNIKDTLRAVLIHFPQFLNNISLKFLQLTIWSSLNPENIVHQESIFPVYSDSLNEFQRYLLDTPVVVNGTFYVGWKQIGKNKIYVGYDKNINNRNKIFYNVSGSWKNASFDGSLLIRPDFGIVKSDTATNIYVYDKYKNNEKCDFKIFPNPVDKQLTIVSRANSEIAVASISMYDLLGQKVYSSSIKNNNEIHIDVRSYPKGMYFLEIFYSSNLSKFSLQQAVKKVVVFH